MKIPAELLSEVNYEGTRLIEVADEKVKELQAKLTELQLEANPTLEKMEKLTPVLDPFYTKMREHQEAINKIKEEMAVPKDEYTELLSQVEKIDQKAQLIKNKITPLVNSIVNPQLGDFEKANQLIARDGKLFVEVVDEIEEKVKAVRQAKANKIK